MRTARIIICLLTFVFLFARPSSASIGLSLTPSIFEANVKPGKTVTAVFTLQNLSEKETTFVARVVPFVPEGEFGQAALKPNLKPNWLKYFSLANNNLKLGQPFTLPPRGSQQLVLSTSVPPRASLADLYATLIISTTTANSLTGTSIGTVIGSNLLITVSPLKSPPALVKISRFVPTGNSYLFRYGDIYIADSLTPVYFTATARNLGKYFTKTSGVLRITSGEKTIALQELLPLNLLANSSRALEGSVSAEINFKPSPVVLGQFLASLDLRSENSSSHSEITLLILPLKLLAAIFLSLLMLAVITLGYSKNKRQRH